MDFSNKWKRSMHWTHTKKGILHHTVSQSAISCQQPQNPVENNTSSYPLSQGSDPKFLRIKRNVIPHKSTSKSCQRSMKQAISHVKFHHIPYRNLFKWPFPENILELNVIVLIFLNARVCQNMYMTRFLGTFHQFFRTTQPTEGFY